MRWIKYLIQGKSGTFLQTFDRGTKVKDKFQEPRKRGRIISKFGEDIEMIKLDQVSYVVKELPRNILLIFPFNTVLRIYYHSACVVQTRIVSM